MHTGDDNVLFTLGKSFCRQLEGVHVTAQMADQLTKNMFFVGKRLLVVFKANNEMATAATHAVKRPRGGKRVPANARHDSGSTSEASGTAAKAALDEGDSEESDGGNYDPDVTSAKSGLVWTFRQMAFVGHYEVRCFFPKGSWDHGIPLVEAPFYSLCVNPFSPFGNI